LRKLRRAFLALALLALAPGQLATAHVGVLAGALAAGSLAHGHSHALSVVRESGHVDVVLHHHALGAGSDEAEATPLGVARHDGDHVVHATLATGAHDASRRATLGAALVVPALTPLAPRRLALHPSPVARAPLAGVDLLRTTVLRL
jgi:hypothetical protein